MESINPATGEKIKAYTEHTFIEVENALYQAQNVFHIWHGYSFEERSAKMNAAAKILRKDKASLAVLMAEEMGKPVTQGEGEIEKCAWACEFFAQNAKAFLAPEPVKTDASKSFIAYEPLGIVLAVMPWNFPFWQVFRCAAPILMAGNAIILKHAANVCGCAEAIEDIFKQAGFPQGLFKSVFLKSEKVAKIIEHPLVSAVTLTGSVQAGKSVASHAGGCLKKTVLELGGSDPYLILEDADLTQAAETCAASRLVNAGQSCVSAKRFIVVESVLKEFQAFFVGQMAKPRMGPPLDRETGIGPLARHDLRDQLHVQVQESVKLGARVLLGGKIPDGPGAFYPPTVLGDVRAGMPAYGDELFGPVAALITVHDEKEAIHVANDTAFGLGGAVFTKDARRGERIALHELQAGFCCVNEAVKSDPRLPFGGIKHSGYGRELSVFGIREFVNIKTVYIK